MRPYITAYAEGKDIQLNIGEGGPTDWYEYGDYQFGGNPKIYRVKPEPNIIEFKRDGKTFKIDLDEAKKLGLVKQYY